MLKIEKVDLNAYLSYKKIEYIFLNKSIKTEILISYVN